MNRLESRLLITLYWGIFLFLSATILYFTNRGLDLTDESMYLCDLVFPAESNIMRKGNVIIAWLSRPLSLDIIGYRWLRWVLTVASTAFFSIALWRWSRPGLRERNPLGGWILAGALLVAALGSYAIFPSTLSYNSLGLVIALTVIGCVLLFLNEGNQAWLIPAGALIVVQAFNKLPSGLILGMMVVLVVSFSPSAKKVVPIHCCV